MTAKQVQIGDRPCSIYGTDCAEYLLLQMADEHELQHMDNEIAAIVQGSAYSFLFAAVPVRSWNDEPSPWETPAVWGKDCIFCVRRREHTAEFLQNPTLSQRNRRFPEVENNFLCHAAVCNASYATIRTFVMKFHEMGLLAARKAGNRVFYKIS